MLRNVFFTFSVLMNLGVKIKTEIESNYIFQKPQKAVCQYFALLPMHGLGFKGAVTEHYLAALKLIPGHCDHNQSYSSRILYRKFALVTGTSVRLFLPVSTANFLI